MYSKFSVVAAVCGALAVSGCTDPGQFSGDGTPNQTRNAAIIGGIAGATIGRLTSDRDDRDKGTLIGAAVGAAAGAAIGNALDRQEAALRQEIGDDRIKITNTGSQLIVTMPQDILFPVDSASLRSDLQNDLRALARNLQEYPASTVDVIGHTDNTGAAAYNQDLSARRASAVASVLIASGVPSGRIRTIGRGEDAPIATNLTDDGRAANRRVDIVINPTS